MTKIETSPSAAPNFEERSKGRACFESNRCGTRISNKLTHRTWYIEALDVEKVKHDLKLINAAVRRYRAASSYKPNIAFLIITTFYTARK
jgi:hypothetical protein